MLQPGVKEMKFGSQLHQDILTALTARLDFSRLRMTDFHDKWRKAEEAELAYMPTKDNDQLRKGKKEQGDPNYVTIVVPYNYALLQSAHTYWTSVFLSRQPVFQFQGRHGEGELQVQALESLIDYQLLVGEWLPPLFIWLHDVAKYGVGVLWSYWDETTETISKIVEQPKEIFGIPIPGTSERKHVTESVPGYQGNRLFNVRPFDFFPDPRVPLWNLQKGEFCGRIYDMSWNDLIKGEREGRYYNIDAVWRNAQRDMDRDASSSQMQMPFDYLRASSYALDDLDKGFNEMLDIVVDLSPFDWKLGSRKTNEKWAFTVANRGTVIGAQPLGMYHNRFPAHPLQYEVEGYQVLARSMMDIIQPLNDTLTWLVNAHFYNVRAALNDQVVIDPSLVEMRDVDSPGPGKVWRLKPAAYGMDPGKVYSQMRVADVTQTHMQDTRFVTDLMQRVTGAFDPIQGAVTQGGRKSATEIRTSSSMGANRLKTEAEWFSAVGFGPMSKILVQATQQMYTTEKRFRIVGDMAQPNMARQISSADIQGFFDYIPVDGTMPVDRFAMASLWRELMGEMRQMPEIYMQYDIGRIFEYVAQLVGLRTIKQFKIQTMSPEQIAMQRAQGNIVPMTGGGGGRGRASKGGNAGPGGATGIQSPPQVSGMGPVA